MVRHKFNNQVTTSGQSRHFAGSTKQYTGCWILKAEPLVLKYFQRTYEKTSIIWGEFKNLCNKLHLLWWPCKFLNCLLPVLVSGCLSFACFFFFQIIYQQISDIIFLNVGIVHSVDESRWSVLFTNIVVKRRGVSEVRLLFSRVFIIVQI